MSSLTDKSYLKYKFLEMKFLNQKVYELIIFIDIAKLLILWLCQFILPSEMCEKICLPYSGPNNFTKIFGP